MNPPKRSRKAAWILSSAVFLIVLGAVYFVGSPKGNPDILVLRIVETVFAAAVAMLVNAVVYPKTRVGEMTGLGAPSVSITVAVVTVALAALSLGCVALRHPVIAGGLSGAVVMLLFLRRPVVWYLSRLFWGTALTDDIPACTRWMAELAAVSDIAKNEVFLSRVSELQVFCARLKKAKTDAERRRVRLADSEIDCAISGLKQMIADGSLPQAEEQLITIRTLMEARSKILTPEAPETEKNTAA